MRRIEKPLKREGKSIGKQISIIELQVMKLGKIARNQWITRYGIAGTTRATRAGEQGLQV